MSRLLFLCPNGLLLTGGDLTVQNVSPVGSLEISSGVFSTGANTLIVGATTSVTRTSGHIDGDLRMIYGAAGSKVFHVGTANGYSPVTANVSALPGNPSSLTIRSVQTVHPDAGSPLSSLKRFWSITETGDLTATLTFAYLDADRPIGVPESSLELNRYTGSGGIFDVIPATIDPTANTITTNAGISNFSDCTLISPLPPTSANASVSGRVFDENGNGVRNAIVTLTRADGSTQNAMTSSLGYFRIEDVGVGQTVVIQIRAKKQTIRSEDHTDQRGSGRPGLFAERLGRRTMICKERPAIYSADHGDIAGQTVVTFPQISVYFKCFSNNARIRSYSSIQLSGRTKAWFSDG